MKSSLIIITVLSLFILSKQQCFGDKGKYDIEGCNARPPEFNRTKCCVITFQPNSQEKRPVCAEVELDLEKINRAIEISNSTYYPIKSIDCNSNYIKYALSLMLLWVIIIV